MKINSDMYSTAMNEINITEMTTKIKRLEDWFGFEVRTKVFGIYDDVQNRNKKYNLVLLSDEELNELEKKTKQ